MTKQEIVCALFTNLENIYVGLRLHKNTLEVRPLADLTLVQDFLEKGLADRDSSEDSSEGENSGGDTNDEGGRKDEGGREDKGGKRGTKRRGHDGGGTNNKQQKTKQHTCPLFKTDFDLDFVLEQTTSLPVEEQLDYFLQVCEPYLSGVDPFPLFFLVVFL